MTPRDQRRVYGATAQRPDGRTILAPPITVSAAVSPRFSAMTFTVTRLSSIFAGTNTSNYACCGLDSTTDQQGITTYTHTMR